MAARAEMWGELSGHSPQYWQKKEDINRRAILVALSEGHLSHACRMLLPDTMAPHCPETMDSLREKHPPREGDPLLSGGEGPTPYFYTVEEVRSAINSFPVGSGAGLSSLRPDHLREVVGICGVADCLSAVTAIVNMMADGSVCEDTRAWITGAVLIALNKKDGGIRPIAVGEVLRRIAGKCAAAHVAGDARNHLLPHQVEVLWPQVVRLWCMPGGM